MSKIDFNLVWDDARAMAVANRDLLPAIAGMFVLLPGAIADQMMSTAVPLARNAATTQTMEQVVQQFVVNWPVVVAHLAVTSFGSLAMLVLLLRPERPTVAQSLRAALLILPSYFLASMLVNLGVFTGALLFILPGLYVVGRLALVAPVAAAEPGLTPVALLRRSALLTHGNGWRIFALLALFYVTAVIIGYVVNILIGTVAGLLLSTEIASLVLSILAGLLEAALALVMVLVTAALYRATTQSAPLPWLG